MSIWNKILLGLIFIASLGFFYMSARMLKTHQYWRNLVHVYEYSVDKEEDIHRGISRGTEFVTGVSGSTSGLSAFYRDRGHSLGLGQEETWRDFETKVLGTVAKTGLIDMKLLRACTFGTRKTLGIRRTQFELHNVLIDRGRVWYNCRPEKVDSKSGKVALIVDELSLSQIAPKMTLFVFEENNIEDKGRYLGQFKVAGVVNEKSMVGLEPAMKMDQRELKRLVRAKAGGPWIMYEIMPADKHALFADLSNAKKQTLLPAPSVQAYLAHGKPAKAEELQGCVIKDGKYARRLRDYEVLFGEYHRQRHAMADQMQAGLRDLRFAQASQTDAKKQVLFRQNEIDELKTELAKSENERDAVTKHFGVLTEKAAAFEKEVERIIASNRATAAQIAKIQLDATRRIDERVRKMADAGK